MRWGQVERVRSPRSWQTRKRQSTKTTLDRLRLVRLDLIVDQVNVYQAKTHLSRLLERVEAGEEIIIGRSGRPVAMLVPYRRTGEPRVPGAWRGRVRIAEGFDALPEPMAAAFRGEAP